MDGINVICIFFSERQKMLEIEESRLEYPLNTA